MADASIPLDILSGVAEAVEEVGKLMTLRKNSQGALDPTDATAGKVLTPSDKAGKVFLFDYKDDSFDGTTVLRGDRIALFDLSGFSPAQPEKNDLLIEDSTTTWKIVETEYTEVQGSRVVCLAQIRK